MAELGPAQLSLSISILQMVNYPVFELLETSPADCYISTGFELQKLYTGSPATNDITHFRADDLYMGPTSFSSTYYSS